MLGDISYMKLLYNPRVNIVFAFTFTHVIDIIFSRSDSFFRKGRRSLIDLFSRWRQNSATTVEHETE